MAQLLVADVAFARAGDKGDTSDVSVFARHPQAYDLLVEQVTVERVRELYGHRVLGDVRRYEVANLHALKFVLEGALGGGGPSSLRADNLGKAMAGAVLRLPLQVDDDLAELLAPRPVPPRDPYREAAWRAGLP